MAKSADKQRAKELLRMAGRQSWNGVKPVTRVIPNKKKVKTDRKQKHKGRRWDAGSYFLAA